MLIGLSPSRTYLDSSRDQSSVECGIGVGEGRTRRRYTANRTSPPTAMIAYAGSIGSLAWPHSVISQSSTTSVIPTNAALSNNMPATTNPSASRRQSQRPPQKSAGSATTRSNTQTTKFLWLVSSSSPLSAEIMLATHLMDSRSAITIMNPPMKRAGVPGSKRALTLIGSTLSNRYTRQYRLAETIVRYAGNSGLNSGLSR